MRAWPIQSPAGYAPAPSRSTSFAAETGSHLNPGGAVYLEVGIGQAGDVLKLLREHLNPADSGAIKDLNGVERVVWAKTSF